MVQEQKGAKYSVVHVDSMDSVEKQLEYVQPGRGPVRG